MLKHVLRYVCRHVGDAKLALGAKVSRLSAEGYGPVAPLYIRHQGLRYIYYITGSVIYRMSGAPLYMIWGA